jgi:hypothetical protein
MKKIEIKTGEISLIAELCTTDTAESIYKALPIESKAHTWGEEVYFSAPVDTSLESTAKNVIEPGEIAYWVEGKCIAIGFGPTPISKKNEIRLAAKTNIWAITKDNVKELLTVKDGDKIIINRLA